MQEMATKTTLDTTIPVKNNSRKKEKNISFDGDKWAKIAQDDCIRFLQSIPDKSVDLIVTDPAYSGMNNKLKLGKGRIIGKYSEKGQDKSKWFSEFLDTEENYHVFLAECKRVLRSTGHIYIMFDSFSLLSLAPVVRQYF